MLRIFSTRTTKIEFFVASLACVVPLVFGAATIAGESDRDEKPLTVLARTGFNPHTGSGMEPKTLLIRDRDGFTRAFGEAAWRIDQMLGQPRIDFERYMVLCVAGGKQPSSGYRVEVQEVVHKRDQGKSKIVVRWVLHKPMGGVLWVLTSPSEVLLVERLDGDPVFEHLPDPKEPAEAADPGRATANEWAALLKMYQSLGLPLPPADAPLVAKVQEMEIIEERDLIIPLHRPKYILGFLLTGGKDKAQILIGTNLSDISPDQVDSLIRINPNNDPPGELAMADAWGDFQTNAGLPTAIQCYHRGWQSLADRLLSLQTKMSRGFGSRESPFFQPPGLQPELALKFTAWAHYGNQLARPGSDRKAVLKQMRELSVRERSFQYPECWGIVQSLAATVEPSRAPAQSTEAVVDDLINLDASLWGDTFILGYPEPIVTLARRGWEVMPTLIEHVSDRRLTRSVCRSVDGSALRLVTIGEILSLLVRQSAGDAGAAWELDAETHQLRFEDVNAWWNKVKELKEEDFLVKSTVPGLPQVTRPYQPLLERLAAKYSARLLDVYKQLLADRPDVNSRGLVQAIAAVKPPTSEIIHALWEGAGSERVARQAEALEALAKLDQHTFESALMRNLAALPTSTPGRYFECEQVELARLCWETNSINVWHTLRDAMRKADVGVRMEIIGQIADRSDLSATRHRRVSELLLAFFDDATVRDVAATPEKYESCAASSWRRIEVRNFAAYKLGKHLGLDVSKMHARRPIEVDEWQEFRNQVAKKCEDLRITPDFPSPAEQQKAKDALRALGVLLLEDDPRTEFRLTNVSMAGLEITNADLRHLGYLPDLQIVELARTPITDEGLRELARCKELRVLDLAGTKITDDGLDHLVGIRFLRGLDLSSTRVTDRGLQRLARLEHLGNFQLNDTKITDAGLESLAKLPKLEIVALRGVRLTDDGLRHLPAAPRLAILDLTGTVVSDTGLASLGKCQALESLTLSLTKVTDAGLGHLSKLSKLRRLYLFGLPITDHGAATIGRFRGLTLLSLTGDNVTDKGMKSLAQLEDLEVLYAPLPGITDEGVRELQSLKKLVRLNLSGAPITDQAIETLRSLEKLEQVVLTGTKVTAKGKEELKRSNPRVQIIE